jgi:hypothetical protein
VVELVVELVVDLVVLQVVVKVEEPGVVLVDELVVV